METSTILSAAQLFVAVISPFIGAYLATRAARRQAAPAIVIVNVYNLGATPSLAIKACTRPLISSRIARTSSIGLPLGSVSGQSPRRKPGMTGH